MNHVTDKKPVPSSIGEMSFNVGTNHDWTKSSAVNIARSTIIAGDKYADWIKKKYVQSFSRSDEEDNFCNINFGTEKPVSSYSLCSMCVSI